MWESTHETPEYVNLSCVLHIEHEDQKILDVYFDDSAKKSLHDQELKMMSVESFLVCWTMTARIAKLVCCQRGRSTCWDL